MITLPYSYSRPHVIEAHPPNPALSVAYATAGGTSLPPDLP
jgi:hypothetical protein